MPRKSKIRNSEEISFAQEDIPTRATANKIFRNEKQKIIEERKEFVPLVTPKITTEIIEKPKLEREDIEKIESNENSYSKPKKRRNKSEKIISNRHIDTIHVENKQKEQVKLEGKSVLIITEKPQAAEKIAYSLSNGKNRKNVDNGVAYYEFEKNKENIIVACAVGHLFSLSQDVKGSDYPIFDISWKPNFKVRKKDFTRKYYSILDKLFKRAKEVIIATDYDIEGEVIGYNIVRFIARQNDAKRMKFSSLTKEEIENAYTNVKPTIDWPQAIAGETRHFIDWYYGINLSRALMNSIKASGKFRIMSVGRVQGPALKLIVNKEREISKFKPRPYWKIFIEVMDKKDNTNIAKLRHVKDIFNKEELKKFEQLKDKQAIVKTEKSKQIIIPPFPFDLTTLQTESYRFFGLSPARTLQVAQSLYLAGVISYPRTSSQKIPEAINPHSILKRLSSYFKETNEIKRDRPIEGKKSDPAHPSIYPTGEHMDLSGEEKKIYELIVKRFISCFCDDALIENKTINAEVDGLIFKEKGMQIEKRGWMKVYDSRTAEKEIRDMNGIADILKVDIEADETKPPKRYSPASIISELEERNLGTKATRANIIETLYERNYIEDNKSIKATPLGINLIETLEKHSPVIIDEELTRNMEKDMDSIREAKKELEKKEETILKKAKEVLVNISKDFKKKEKEIGEDLLSAEKDYWKQQNQANELMECPVCKKGKLTIKYSPKNKKHFIACNAYPECKTTYSLPPYGVIKKVLKDNQEKKCDKCGYPLLMCLRKGKSPWIFCFNEKCPSREAEKEHNYKLQKEMIEGKDYVVGEA
jgi:DNA topoisomerase-1